MCPMLMCWKVIKLLNCHILLYFCIKNVGILSYLARDDKQL